MMKTKERRKNWSKGLFALSTLLFVCSWQACDTPTDGCTDPIAQNFNPEADKDCCCAYYQLKLSTQYLANDSSALELLSSYANPSGNDSFQVQSARLLLSDIQLINNAGQAFGIEDSILLTLGSASTANAADDFMDALSGQFVLTAGKFTHLGNYTAVAFSVGLAPQWQTASQSALPDAHALLSFYSATDQRYRAQRWSVVRNATQDTLSYEVSDTTRIVLAINKTVVDGADTAIPINILYDKLWQGIDWYNDDSLSVVQKLKTNSHNAFVIRP